MIRFTEENQQYWVTTPESKKPHCGLPSDLSYEVRKFKGRFMLKSNEISPGIPPFIYPIGCTTELIHILELEYLNATTDEHDKAFRSNLLDRL